MTKRLFSFNIDEELINQVDNTISNSKSRYKDRTQFIILAIQEKLKKEVDKNGNNTNEP